MYTVYKQLWNDGRVSYHRSKDDILEFGKTHNLERAELHREVRQADYTAVKALEGTLGVFR